MRYYKHAARLGLFCALSVITWLALANDPPLSGAFVVSDKLNHLGAFFVLALLADAAFPKQPVWPQLIALAGYGLLLESMQYLTGYRYFEWSDLAADVAGIVLYLPVHGRLNDLVKRRVDASQKRR